jgi:hypothetical protein
VLRELPLRFQHLLDHRVVLRQAQGAELLMALQALRQPVLTAAAAVSTISGSLS